MTLMRAFTPEACQSFQEISLASGLSGKHNGPAWLFERWMLPMDDIHPEGKVM